MFFNNQLHRRLVADSTLTALLDSIGSDPAIVYDRIMPETFTGNKSINYYLSEPYDPNISYGRETYSINCRAATLQAANAIALQLITTLSRANIAVNTFSKIRILPPIPPVDSTDNFNVPVECIIQNRD